MNPFEAQEINKDLRDANNRPVETAFLPDEDVLRELDLKSIKDLDTERIRLISNIEEDETEEEEGWCFSDTPSGAARLTVEKVMRELTGKSWFDEEKEEGYSIGEIIDLLSQRTFVQLSRLTEANVRSCIEQGGEIIAYFPELVWREYFNMLTEIPTEILGMRAVEIEGIDENGMIVINDLCAAKGKGICLDKASFDWLSRDGWMLEVYK